MNGREQQLPESCLWTSQEQRNLVEGRLNRSFKPTLWLSSTVEVLYSHPGLSAPTMSTDMSQVGFALIPLF